MISKTFVIALGAVLLSGICGFFLVSAYLQPSPLPDTTPPASVYPSFVEQRIIDQAYDQAATTTPTTYAVTSLILPHHLLASELISQGLLTIKKQKPSVIVLISPNHFSAGHGKVISTLNSWATPYGQLDTNQKIVNQLQTSGFVSLESDTFIKEHGIGNLAGFIKKTFPKASLVPIILKDSLSTKDSRELAAALAKILPEDSLIIASLDMSHYLTADIASSHDQTTIATLASGDSEAVSRLDTDSRPALRLLLSYNELKKSQKFNLLHNSNSALIAQQPASKNVTSYITGYFTAGSAVSEPKATILVTGLISDTKKLIRLIDRPISLEDPFWRLLHTFDLTWMNVTSPILTTDKSKLTERGFNLAQDSQGFSLDFTTTTPYLTKEIRGLSVTFISFNQATDDIDTTIATIKEARPDSDQIIISSRGTLKPAIAYQLIGAGTDLIISNNGQSAYQSEIYQSKTIIYNLGNLNLTSGSTTALGLTISPSAIDLLQIPLKYSQQLELQ
jgi:AmmeMemoRadiSam system protein B